MLASAQTLRSDILSLSPTTDKIQGLTNFVAVIANYMNRVQAGASGTVGIFALDQPAMRAVLFNLEPVNNNSWIAHFVNAYLAGSNGAAITPGTVTNPAWLGSGTKDVATLPTGSATILSLSAAATTLTNKLLSARPDEQAPLTIAEGIHDATLDFVFNCIGLGAPPSFTPIPIPESAL